MVTKQVSFAVTKDEAALIAKIVIRAKKMGLVEFSPQDSNMDLSACIANGCPLRLREFLAADDFNFIHDFRGIARHIDQTTGELQNHFCPRFAVPRNG